MSHNGHPLLAKFAKYQGHGNDFIIMDHPGPEALVPELQKSARRWCDRHIGIGADGIVVLARAHDSLKMTVINADGSLAKNCGNGLRCAARWYFDDNPHESQVTIVLGSRNYLCQRAGEDIFVPMGECRLESLEESYFHAMGQSAQIFRAELANLHVIFVFKNKAGCLDMQGCLAEAQQKFPAWPEYNLSFVGAEGDGYTLQVFERGVGFTQSCGSGACAAACALSLGSPLGQERKLILRQPGGKIVVTTQALRLEATHTVFAVGQAGGASAVFRGNVCI